MLRRNDALERRRCARWWELCVGGVRDGGAELRWSSEKGGAVRWWLVEEEEVAALELRWSVGTVAQSCAGALDVRRTMGAVRDGGAGRRRTEGWPEKMKSQNNEGIGVF